MENTDVIMGLDAPTELLLVSNEGKKYFIPRKYIEISKVLSASLSDGENKQDMDEEGRVVLPIDLSSEILDKIVEYMNIRKGVEINILNMGKSREDLEKFDNLPTTIVRHKNIEVCQGDRNKANGVPKTEADFIRSFSKVRRVLFEVCEAANKLHIESLLHACCATIACIIKGVPEDRVKVIMSRDYVAPDDADEEEIEKTRREEQERKKKETEEEKKE